jgi:phosphatidylglycerol:prolipoprotein diacylglycerol transferase
MLVLPVLPFPAIDPVLISIGPLAIRWYALAYNVGIIAGWFYARALIASKGLWGGPAPLTVVDFDDFVIWITLGIILGGRIGYVLLLQFRLFAAHPLEISEPWNGGSRSMGASSVAVSPTSCSRCAAACRCFAQRRDHRRCRLASFLGRLANHRRRALGPPKRRVVGQWSLPNERPVPRHPSQLYEAALEGLVLFALLAVLVWLGGLKRPGLVTGAFAVGYGVARVVCELFREPDAQLGFFWGGLTMGMLLCIPVILAGAALIGLALRREPIAKNG